MLDYYREAWMERTDRSVVTTIHFVVWGLLGSVHAGLRQRLAHVRTTRRRSTAAGRHGGDYLMDTWMSTWLEDARIALRGLRRSPGFTATVVLILALGVGANVAVFSVVNSVLFAPLPYRNSGELLRMYQVRGESAYWSLPALMYVRENSKALSGVAPAYTYRETGVDLTSEERPERLRALPVGADYFRLIEQPMIGRGFRRDEERDDARLAILSANLWRRLFPGVADPVGRTLTLEDLQYEVVGVMPDGFRDPFQATVDLWVPLSLRTGGYESWEWDNNYLSAAARLVPGVTIDQARAEVDLLFRDMRAINPQKDSTTARMLPLHQDIAGGAEVPLYLLLGAVGLLFLITCVNVGSLVLTRGTARYRDFAIRAALGSPRPRMVRQLLLESGVLALGGAAVGALFAAVIVRSLGAQIPADLLPGTDLHVDLRVFGFGLGLTVLAVGLTGLWPAARLSRPRLAETLVASARGSTAGRVARVRRVLVVAEVALALVLLVGAGVLVRSFERLAHVELHLDPADVTTFTVNLPDIRYGDPAARVRFQRELQRRFRTIPGVRAAGAVSWLPASGAYHSWGARRAAAIDVPEDMPSLQTDQRVVEGEYFQALSIPVLRGRTFDSRDTPEAPRRVVVNEALVKALYLDGDPIGRILRVAGAFPEIIGVVADVPIGPRGEVRPKVYHSHAQFADNRNWTLTQTVKLAPGPTTGFLDAARGELRALDPDLVLDRPTPLADVVGRGIGRERFVMLLIGAFAAVAVVLAAVGIYGVLVYGVRNRRREISIRLALGARPGTIRGMVVRDGVAVAALGLVLGLCGAAGATRFLASMVYQVSVLDPASFVLAAVGLGGVALLASVIPARAATLPDPAEALREE